MMRLLVCAAIVCGCGVDADPLDDASVDASVDASAPDVSAIDAGGVDAPAADALGAIDAPLALDATAAIDALGAADAIGAIDAMGAIDARSFDAGACIPPATPTGITALDGTGRVLNGRGIHLTDWDGFVANPAPTIRLRPPSDLSYPMSATLSADHQRLYFDLPSSVGATGPTKSVNFASASSTVDIRLGAFPDRDGIDEAYTLTMTIGGRSESVAITIHDRDLNRTIATPIIVDFSKDTTGFFGSATARAILQAAADDWAYFIADPPFDIVPIGAESTWIWRDDGFVTGSVVTNASAYRGFLLYTYGIHSTALRSGGEGSYQGMNQHSGGAEIPVRRSGGLEVETYGNYNSLGWRMDLDPDTWWVSGNLGAEQNDLYSIVHHELGHAHGFSDPYSLFAAGRPTGLSTPELTAYLGRPLAIDASAHFSNTIDPASGFGAHGWEYNGVMPRRRWIITRTDLLALEAIGYTLRPLDFSVWDDPTPDCP